MNKLIALAIAASAAFVTPAIAQQHSVSVKSGSAISAVYDPTEIAMSQLPGGRASIGFEADPAFFAGASLCIAGLDGNWPLKKNGTLHVESPRVRSDGTVDRASVSPRTPSCAPIAANGTATVRNPFGPRAVPFILRDGRIIAWAGRDRLTGLDDS